MLLATLRAVRFISNEMSCQSVCSKKEMQRSRSGYYTVTFFNRNNLDENEIIKEFSSVGTVCKVIKNSQRVFIRFKEKDEAERAIEKFGKVYELDMARNKSDNQQPEGGSNHSIKPYSSHNTVSLSPSEDTSLAQSMEKLNMTGNIYHLVLGNLPKNYTINDVRALVEEAKPICINQLEETRVFSIRFCHIVLSSPENVEYLVDKLNGFVIAGEKLIAAEAKHLLEWRAAAI